MDKSFWNQRPLLWKQFKIESWLHHTLLFFCVILGWAVTVAILGPVFNAIAGLGKFVLFLYEQYKSQPIFCILTTVTLGLVATGWYFLPTTWRPSRTLRIVIPIAIWFLLMVLGVPVLNALSSGDAETEAPNNRIEANVLSGAAKTSPHP